MSGTVEKIGLRGLGYNIQLDPHHLRIGWADAAFEKRGLEARPNCRVHDLLTDARYLWHGSPNYVKLNPRTVSAHGFAPTPHPNGTGFRLFSVKSA